MHDRLYEEALVPRRQLQTRGALSNILSVTWWDKAFFSNKTMSDHMGLRSAGVSWSKEYFLWLPDVPKYHWKLEGKVLTENCAAIMSVFVSGTMEGHTHYCVHIFCFSGTFEWVFSACLCETEYQHHYLLTLYCLIAHMFCSFLSKCTVLQRETVAFLRFVFVSSSLWVCL